MSSWPSTILPKTTGGFSGGNSPTTTPVVMESGRIRTQRRFSSEQRLFSAEWEMNDWQFGMFQSFLAHKINAGEDAFLIELPMGGGGYREVSAKIVDGEFSADLKTPNNDWLVKAQLEVEDAEVWSEATFDAGGPS